jgi:chaperonin GroES
LPQDVAPYLMRDRTTIYTNLYYGELSMKQSKRIKNQYNQILEQLSIIERTRRMNLQPLYHFIIVEPDAPDTKYGQIFLPDTGQQPKRTGVVVAVGTGRVTPDNTIIPLRVAVGDKVLFGEYSGLETEWQGKIYKTMREDEVIAIVLGDE